MGAFEYLGVEQAHVTLPGDEMKTVLADPGDVFDLPLSDPGPAWRPSKKKPNRGLDDGAPTVEQAAEPEPEAPASITPTEQ